MDFKRLIEKRSAESDEVIEIMPLTIDPSFDPNFIPPVSINIYIKSKKKFTNYLSYTPPTIPVLTLCISLKQINLFYLNVIILFNATSDWF